MDIEELAATKPDAIRKISIDPRYGLFGFRMQYELKKAGVEKGRCNQIVALAKKLFQTYWAMDGELIEINPLVVTGEGELLAADAKFNIDNSGLFRQPEVPRRRARGPEERAGELGISYVLLDGNIGIISNGAGLTMSAMDYIRLKGASPANFLDLGGGATQAVTIKNSMGIVLENPAVNALLIYIFAGGPRCDVIAEGIVEACLELEKESRLNVPIVVTLHGRNAEEGRKIIENCKSSYVTHVPVVEDAVNKVIELGGAKK
jgi:succinyl-CoA synthetase beta subunit